MVSVIVRHTLVQLRTPDEMRGRVSAVNMVFIGASNEVGQFESGVTAQWFGTVPAVVGGWAPSRSWCCGRLVPGVRRVDELFPTGTDKKLDRCGVLVYRRDAQGGTAMAWLESVVRDVRFGTRVLFRDRDCLGRRSSLALARNRRVLAASFSLIDALILRRIPVAQPAG